MRRDPGEKCSALEVAGNLRVIRYWVRRRYGSFPRSHLEDLVGETALELVRRHRRAPELRGSRWILVDFAARQAHRRLWPRRGRILVALADDFELAVPPNQITDANLGERYADEMVEDAIAEFAAERPSERCDRILETCRLLGTSPPSELELAEMARECQRGARNRLAPTSAG